MIHKDTISWNDIRWCGHTKYRKTREITASYIKIVRKHKITLSHFVFRKTQKKLMSLKERCLWKGHTTLIYLLISCRYFTMIISYQFKKSWKSIIYTNSKLNNIIFPFFYYLKFFSLWTRLKLSSYFTLITNILTFFLRLFFSNIVQAKYYENRSLPRLSPGKLKLGGWLAKNKYKKMHMESNLCTSLFD